MWNITLNMNVKENLFPPKIKINVFCTKLQKHLKIYPKGLDSSNNIDSGINITTFLSLPHMFRRYLRHLQCYIFFTFVTLRWQYCVLTSLTELVTLSYLQGESQDYVFHLLVEVGFLLFYLHRFLTLYLSLTRYLVAAESRISKQ